MQVLRTIFFLLVLGNLLLFAWGQGYLGKTTGGGESERLSAQIDPGRLHLVGKGVPPSTPATLPKEACRALAGLERETADKLVELLAGREAQLRVDQHPLNEPSSWWLHIPPSSNSAQADKKAAELARLGIKDFFIVRESGPNQYAISLGLYKSEESAKAYLDVLQKKKVKTARIQVRETAGDKIVVEVRGNAEGLAKAMADLPPEFASVQKAECAAAKP